MCCLIFSINVQAQCDFQEVALSQNITHQFHEGALAGGVSFMDFDRDGWDDLTFGTSKGETIEIYRNHQGLFDKVTLPGITNTCESKQVTWVDFDNDGDKDLYYSCAEGGVVLYQNDGALSFTEITTDYGLSLPDALSFGSNWADFDKDGWLDLYITYYGGLRNQFFRNLQGTGFENISVNANIDTANKPSFCAVVFDYDQNGWEDIYIANDRSVRNDLVKNLGESAFENVSSTSQADLPMNAMGTTILDINGDGFFEIYISNSHEGNALLFNNGDGTFQNIAESSGTLFNSVGWGVNTLDIDNDACSDLYVSGSNQGTETLSSALYRGIDGETFEQTDYPGMAVDTMVSYSNAVGDFNNDGKMDIAVSNGNATNSQLWKNQCVNQNHWLRVQLEGTISNRDAIGAQAVAYCLGVPTYQYKTAGIGFMAQNTDYLHFGLAEFDFVDSLLVLWPSGLTDRIINPKIDQVLEVTEGETARPVPLATSTSIDELCEGEQVTLSVALTGRDIRINWSDNSQESSLVVTEDGNYQATITAGQHTITSETVSIDFSKLPKVSYEVTPVSNDGLGQIVISEEAGPYTYRWSHDINLSSSTASNLEPGTYSVKISSGPNCLIRLDITVESLIVTGIDDPLTQSITYQHQSNQLHVDIPYELRLRLRESKIVGANGQTLHHKTHEVSEKGAILISDIPKGQMIVIQLRFSEGYLVKKLIFIE